MKRIKTLGVLLILGVIFLTGCDLKQNESEEKVTKKEEVKKVEKKDITDTELAKKLEKSLVSYDNYSGLYLSKKVTIDDTDNIDLIAFNLREYKNDKKLSYYKDEPYNDKDGNQIGGLNLTIKKSDFNTYMQKEYNTKNNYNIDLGLNDLKDSSPLDACITLLTDDNNYNFVSIGASCGNSYVMNKLVKAEQNNDEIYLYDKAVYCVSDIGTVCNKIVSNATTDSVLDCTSDVTEGTNNCPVENDPEHMADYVINNMSDQLNTYKHTFEKGKDGEYYWVSSEIEE